MRCNLAKSPRDAERDISWWQINGYCSSEAVGITGIFEEVDARDEDRKRTRAMSQAGPRTRGSSTATGRSSRETESGENSGNQNDALTADSIKAPRLEGTLTQDDVRQFLMKYKEFRDDGSDA